MDVALRSPGAAQSSRRVGGGPRPAARAGASAGRAPRPVIQETRCGSALNRVQNMPFRWSLNPYRGCQHGCHYCFARRTHIFLDLNADEDFETVLFVKINVAVVLREALARPSWKREVVAVGTAADPYQPLEGWYRLTRVCLEAFRDVRSPFHLITKGTMIIRDRDLLAEATCRTDVFVFFSVTTMNHRLWRRRRCSSPRSSRGSLPPRLTWSRSSGRRRSTGP